MSNHPIPQNIDLYILDILCHKNLGRSFVYDGTSSISPTSITFTPDLSVDDTVLFDSLVEKVNAINNLNVLPQWASWTATEASDFINNNIFGGLTQTQVDAQIDALPATIAGMKTGLKQAATAILSVRSILQNMAKAIVYIRNLLIKS